MLLTDGKIKMSREYLIDFISVCSVPPFFWHFEEREAYMKEIVSLADITGLDLFIDLQLHPPQGHIEPFYLDNWNETVDEFLQMVGIEYSTALFSKLETILHQVNQSLRSRLMIVIGSIGLVEGLELLRPWYNVAAQLDANELYALADAIGMIYEQSGDEQGKEAREMLISIRERLPDQQLPGVMLHEHINSYLTIHDN
jgi:hypothetical protein